MDKPKMEPMAIISMITGIVSLLCVFPGWCCGLWFIAPAPAIAAVILGIMARNKIKQEPEKLTGNTLTIVGLICGALSLLLFLVLIALTILMYAGVLTNEFMNMHR